MMPKMGALQFSENDTVRAEEAGALYLFVGRPAGVVIGFRHSWIRGLVTQTSQWQRQWRRSLPDAAMMPPSTKIGGAEPRQGIQVNTHLS